MALTKQPVNIPFAQGVDQKTDPFQIPMGKFARLINSVFTTTNRLTKRNGFPKITTLPNAEQTTLTTLNDNLLATGSNLYAFSQDTDQWLNQGSVQPVSLSVQSLIRNSKSQFGSDAAVSASGLTCLVYEQSGGACYTIVDSVTGQSIVASTLIAATATQVRAFVLNRYFIITFTATVSAASHLQYIAIPLTMPASPISVADISTTLTGLDIGYDAFVVNNSLYIAWSDTTDMKVAKLSSSLVLSAATLITSQQADLVSVTADESGISPIIWVSWFDGTDVYAASFNQGLAPILAPTSITTSVDLTTMTSVATAGVLTMVFENDNDYASTYPSSVRTDFISKNTITNAGVVGTLAVVLRSVGLGSKAFIADTGIIYMLASYGETNQPTYFLIDSLGSIYMRLAYSNGGGYKSTQVLPSVHLIDDTYYVSYEIKDFLATVNKNTNISPAPSTVNAIYTQTGVNLAKFSINTSGQYSSEIANALHLTGGQLWMYDSVVPVEHSFQVWPENTAVTTTGSGGLITAQKYFYVFTYEWTDNQGNLHRSAPSVPISITTSGATSTNTLYIPTLRLTEKTNVRIVAYRWSVAQQTYYQITSITSPTLNNPAVDFVTITDTLADSAILGQTLLYTSGGVVEHIAAPASIHSCLFGSRLILIPAENPNTLWFSKQVIQNVPVEMSDLFTIFVAPTTGAQASTGLSTAVSAMDDKLIVFKRNAIYYITGKGPDNTGANNDYSDPIFIASSVGCTNPRSIVLIPNGIMFQSDKGIWLLGRDLSTTYIGADVEAYNDQSIVSAIVIPGTTQVRFTLTNNITLMYDYFYGQWGEFTNLQAISATLYQTKHTYLNQYGTVFQERIGTYTDGSKPVLMSFTTGPIATAGIQGFQRFYFMYLLGTYKSPFKLNMQIAYDFSQSPSQSIVVTPDNNSPVYGGDPLYGAGQFYGGPGNVFRARVFPQQQKCEAFQISMTETYDSTLGVAAGEGLTLSGLCLVVGAKRGFRTQKAAQSFG